MDYSCILLSALHFALMLSMGTASGVGQDVAAVEIGAGTMLLMESRLGITGGNERTLPLSSVDSIVEPSAREKCLSESGRELGALGERRPNKASVTPLVLPAGLG